MALRQTSAPTCAVHKPVSVGLTCPGSTGKGVPFANFGTHLLCDAEHHDWAGHWASFEQVGARGAMVPLTVDVVGVPDTGPVEVLSVVPGGSVPEASE